MSREMVKSEKEARKCFEKQYKEWNGSKCANCMYEEFCWKLLDEKGKTNETSS